jgi:undecaprenyl diphosphate synthase
MVANPARPQSHPHVPAHVAIIMDGNGRWAKRRALPRITGHRAGIKPVRETVKQCAGAGVQVLTLFAFSSENWRRPPEEISGLMGLFLDALDREVTELDANGIRLSFVGDRAKLSAPLMAAAAAAEQRTGANDGMRLVIAVAYGGRWDVVQAARKLAAEARAGSLDPAAIDESRFEAALETSALPNVDLLIRTGGEKRVSNFLLWDIAYSELFFTDVLWPDFGSRELQGALAFYAQRQRRFGQTGEQIEAARC